jgi:hypothetical protein
MTANLSLEEFIGMIKSNFIANTGTQAYGFANMYNRTFNENTGQWTVKSIHSMKKKKYKNDFAENLKKTVGETVWNKGAYKFQPIDMIFEIECVPRIASDGNLHTLNNLLLITISDLKSESNKAMGKKAMEALAQNLVVGVSGEKDTSGKQEEKPKDSKTVESGDAAKGGTLLTEELITQEVVKALQFGMPVLRYGIEGSVLKTCTMSTEMDEAVQNRNLRERKGAGAPSHLTPSGRGQGGVPVQTFPSKFQIVCLGCPLLKFGQMFYVDMGTGTTADGIYTSIEWQHVIKAGVFETSFGLSDPSADGVWQSEDVLKAMEAAAKDD